MLLNRALLGIIGYCFLLAAGAGASADTNTLVPSQSAAQSIQVNVLPAHREHVHLSAGMYYFEAFSKMSLSQVLSLPDSVWQFRQESALYLGAAQSYTWIRIPLQLEPGANEQWVMTIDWPLIQSIDWFQYSVTTQSIVAQGSFYEWQIPADSPDEFPFAFRLQPDTQETTFLYLRIFPSEKVLVPVTFWTEPGFKAHQQQRNWYLGLFYGVLLAMFGYNISLFIFLRHKGFAAYCFYVMTMAGYTLIMNGAGIAWLIGELPALIAHAYRIFVPLGFLGAVVFIRQFLSLSKHGALLNYSSLAACYTWIAFVLFATILPPAVLLPAIEIFGFMNCIYGFSVSVYLWLKGDTSAKYLTISWTILIVSTVILILGLTDFIPYQIELHYLQNIGVTIEVLLLSMALAERINHERQMRYEAQDTALQMSSEAAKAKQSEMAAQERLLNIERRVKEELSLKVNEQTRELKVAMQKMQIMNKELERLSLTDPLTGLANRRYFDKRFHEEVQRAKRSQTNLGVLMIDIDHFKQINDRFGHQAGDHIIQTLSALIQRISGRASDIPARIGGEEFCLLVCNETASSVITLAETLCSKAAAEPVNFRKDSISYTISIGVCSLIPEPDTEAFTVLKAADDALYQAKATGRNRVVIATTDTANISVAK